jgi:bifunctional non-homologous end joining protein LigD
MSERESTRLGLPDLLRPMLATPGELPAPSEDGRWAYEMKWDGVRAIGYVQDGTTRLMSRNDLDVTVSYPDVLDAPDPVRQRWLALDGELVAPDELGRPSFGRLQERMHIRDRAAVRRLAGRVPVFYYVFDLLRLDNRPLLQLPYTERRALLEELDLDATRWRIPPSFPGPAADIMAASAQHGLEGIVAKRRASTYRTGQRSSDWRKVKHQRMQEVVIAGWRPGHGRRAGGIGSLILGVPDEHGELQHVGGVGTGFTDRTLDELGEILAPLRQDVSPFPSPLPRAETRDAIWVRPHLVGQVAYAEWTTDGHLRHSSWRGLRLDKDARQVYRERTIQSDGGD